jgi:hypothetical protein
MIDDVTKLVLPFFSTPRDYADVLKQLAMMALYEVYFLAFLLRAIPQIDAIFKVSQSWGPIGKALAPYDVLNPSGLLLAIIVAALTFSFRFHDRVSDLFRIRRRFDIEHVLIPLLRGVDPDANEDKERRVARHRDELMRPVYYKYTSSTDPSALVDKHDIQQALSAWLSFWVFLEGIFYFGTAAAIAWWLKAPNLSIVLGGISTALFLLAILQRLRLPQYSKPQVEKILNDPTASYDVKKRFDAIQA